MIQFYFLNITRLSNELGIFCTVSEYCPVSDEISWAKAHRPSVKWWVYVVSYLKGNAKFFFDMYNQLKLHGYYNIIRYRIENIL